MYLHTFKKVSRFDDQGEEAEKRLVRKTKESKIRRHTRTNSTDGIVKNETLSKRFPWDIDSFLQIDSFAATQNQLDFLWSTNLIFVFPKKYK